MFKVKNKDTRTTPQENTFARVSFLTFFFTPCSSVSIANFKQVNAGWDSEKLGSAYLQILLVV